MWSRPQARIAWAWACTNSVQDGPDGGGADLVAEASEFAVDASVALGGVLGGQADDEEAGALPIGGTDARYPVATSLGSAVPRTWPAKRRSPERGGTAIEVASCPGIIGGAMAIAAEPGAASEDVWFRRRARCRWLARARSGVTSFSSQPGKSSEVGDG